MGDSVKALNIKVIGKVQGVGYRASANEKAKSLNLFGWVQNTSDGGVEIHVQGDEISLNNMADWSHYGPATAIVTDVKITHVKTIDNLDDFKINW